MLNRRSFLMVASLTLILALGLMSLGSLIPLDEDAAQPVYAGAESDAGRAQPAPLPRQDAVFTVGAATFESQYPEGWSVSLPAKSSAGELNLERTRFVWEYASRQERQTRRINVEDVEYDAVSGLLSARWEPNSTQDMPPWVLIEFTWELRDSEGNEFVTAPVTAEYNDPNRDWMRVETDFGIVIATDMPEYVDQLVLEAYNEQLPQYVEIWGEPLPYKPRIVLFGSPEAWLEWQTVVRGRSEVSTIVGLANFTWGGIFQWPYGAESQEDYREFAYGTVLHEMAHLYQQHFLANRRTNDVPGWYVEGEATFFEMYQDYDFEQRVRSQFAAIGELPPLLVPLADAPRVDGPTPRDGYDIGYTFFVWMHLVSGGADAHREIAQMLADDVPFFTALELGLGMNKGEIERQWRVWLGASGTPPTLIPTPTFIAPVIVTPSMGQ